MQRKTTKPKPKAEPLTITIGYKPHPKQVLFHKTAANEVLFGGSAGPGKSRALREEALIWCLRIPGLQVYLFRRTFPELEKNHILPSMEYFPRECGTYKAQARRWECVNGSMLHFCHCQYDQDVFSYQGAEIHLLVIDELTTFSEFIYDYLRSRVRCTLNIPEQFKHKIPGILCASNPGGEGHVFVKTRWVDSAPAYQIHKAPNNEGGMNRVYIPALLDDNPTLTDNDPTYELRLEGLPEPFKTAYRYGRWDIFIGQAFNFDPHVHVCDPFPIPKNAPIYTTFDWGFGAPFSWGWWWCDADGRGWRFAEWYGWTGEKNKGLRYEDSRVAEDIVKKEADLSQQYGIDITKAVRLAGPDCFSKKPDYKGGGQGPSTAEVFSQHGLYLQPGDASRELKIRQFRERLRVPKDEMGKQNGLPMMMVYSCCTQFIRTIPLIQIDLKNTEYIVEDGETHCFDDACHFAMARPIGLQLPKPLKVWSDARLDTLQQPITDKWTRDVAYQDQTFVKFAQGKANDPRLADTVPTAYGSSMGDDDYGY